MIGVLEFYHQNTFLNLGSLGEFFSLISKEDHGEVIMALCWGADCLDLVVERLEECGGDIGLCLVRAANFYQCLRAS